MEILCSVLTIQKKGGFPVSKDIVSETGKETITKQCGKCYNQAEYSAFGDNIKKVALNPYSDSFFL